jgi:chromosomal replication initiation ATPase DnaA
LATAPIVEIALPNACLTRDLVEQLLVQRGLQPAPQLGSYIAARIERSYAAIHAAVAAIDAHALAHGGGAGIRTARAALIAAGLYDGTALDSDSPEPA